MERLVGEVRDDNPTNRDAELPERRGEDVVGERPLRGQALELHRDRVRLPGADPDRQVALAVELLEDDDMLAREHVDADALHGHLDQPELERVPGHGPIIPRPTVRPTEAPGPRRRGGGGR